MRSLTVMTMCSGNQAISHVVKPNTKLGNNADASRQVKKINNIPDSITDRQAVRLFDLTVDITWLEGKQGRLEFDFSELGKGRIIKE